MTGLEPLAETSENELTRALLRAGRTDAAPADFSNKLMVGLGVASAAASVSAAASASTVAGASSVAKLGSGSASLLVASLKWVAVGVVGGGILASGVELVVAPSSPPAAVALAPQVAATVPAVVAPRVEQQAPVAVAPSAAPEPVPPKAAVIAAPAAVPSPSSGLLGREVLQIDRARAALAGGDAARALRELDIYVRVAQTGVLEREARVLRIDALERLGRSAEARTLAAEYLKAFPNDAHAARLKALLHEAP